MAKRVKLKESKKSTKRKGPSIDLDYLHRLCVEVYTDYLEDENSKNSETTSREREITRLTEKYKGDEEKAIKRYESYAQIYAPTVRRALAIMLQRGHLPPEAINEE